MEGQVLAVCVTLVMKPDVGSREGTPALIRSLGGDLDTRHCGPRLGAFVQNLKEGGCVHRVAPQSSHLPRSKRRTMCGWRYDGVGTLIGATFRRLDESSRRCQKCFPHNGAAAVAAMRAVQHKAEEELESIQE